MKLFNKISDSVFRTTDRFFKGGTVTEQDCPFQNEHPGNELSMVWELNQGFEDIVLKDISSGINFFVPSFIRNRVTEAYKQACLFFLTDMIIEEETIDPEIDKATRLNLLSIPVEKIININNDQKHGIKARILYLQDWLKIKLQRASQVLRHLQQEKPYYLLADFTPRKNDLATTLNCCINNTG
jgi:hypothetical protein